MAVKQIPNLPAAVFVSPTAQIEIVQNGVTMRASAGQVAGLGGGGFTLVNDTTSTQTNYPMFSRVSAGTLEVVYASDPNYRYTPSEGKLSALRTEAMQGIYLNANSVTQDYTIPSGDNGMSAGPITVSATVVVPSGSAWTIV